MKLYGKQRDILESIVHDKQTYVHAANATGKTRIAAIAAIWFFASRTPARVISTSSSEAQLKSILWSEITSLISQSRVPLPFDLTHLLLRKVKKNGEFEELDFCIGLVARAVESFQGHHLPYDKPRVLAIFEEASGISDDFKEAADSWAHRCLVIGNPLSTATFFYRDCKGGVQSDPSGETRYFRNVIHIDALDSPNVQIGLEFKRRNITAKPPILIPGIIGYAEYLQRKQDWDEVKQTTRLHGRFYEGEQTLLYPMDWLDRSQDAWRELEAAKADADDNEKQRKAKAIGLDVAMGGRDNTVWVVIDEFGVLELIEMDTPNTMEIPGRTIELMKRWKVPAKCVAIDAGGGGKQIADRLREIGHKIEVVGFGEAATDRKSYPNRRAEMYGTLRGLLNPTLHEQPFAIPAELHSLRQELAVLPLMYDSEGRLILPPKEKRGTLRNTSVCLREILGRSPDRADALVLATWVLTQKSKSVFKLDPQRLAVTNDEMERHRNEVESRMAAFLRKL